jgi:hypothetical protein
MQRVIDLGIPFIAIRSDEPGNQFMATMGEYLCNPLAEDLFDVRVSIDGFFSDELGVVESEPNSKGPFDLPAGKAHRFCLSTQDEYDEMVVSWSVRYRKASGESVTLYFGSFKRLADTRHFAEVPILGGPALVVPRSLADHA